MKKIILDNEEIIGKKFGKLLVIGERHTDKWGCAMLKCRCECGFEGSFRQTHLKSGERQQCRSCTISKPIKAGSKFHDYTVLEFIGTDKNRQLSYKCQCKCGAINNICSASLREGNRRMCIRCARVTHGMANNVLYNLYRHLLDRCYNKKHPSYKSYGDRGISMHSEWLEPTEGVKKFIEYIENKLGPRPDNPPGWKSKMPYYQLDRINNNGNYEPGNLRWATTKENSRNKRTPTQMMSALKEKIHQQVEYIKLLEDKIEKYKNEH